MSRTVFRIKQCWTARKKKTYWLSVLRRVRVSYSVTVRHLFRRESPADFRARGGTSRQSRENRKKLGRNYIKNTSVFRRSRDFPYVVTRRNTIEQRRAIATQNINITSFTDREKIRAVFASYARVGVGNCRGVSVVFIRFFFFFLSRLWRVHSNARIFFTVCLCTRVPSVQKTKRAFFNPRL